MTARRSMWTALLCFAAAGLLVVLAGCQRLWPTVAPSADPREVHVLAETARFAAALKVSVTGRITEHVLLVNASVPRYPGEKVPAAGWYHEGVAYYFRPAILAGDLAYGTALAAHETCHATTRSEVVANQCAQRLIGGN